MEVPLSGPRLDCVPDGALAQLGERRLCKPEVTGSIPVRSTRFHAGLRNVCQFRRAPQMPQTSRNALHDEVSRRLDDCCDRPAEPRPPFAKFRRHKQGRNVESFNRKVPVSLTMELPTCEEAAAGCA